MKWILYILLSFGFTSNYAQGITPATAGIIASQIVNCPADATSFISAAGITNATEKAAICQLVTDLNTYGLWSKLDAIYPMVGGTATSMKYNLKSPVDADASFRIVWAGGWSYSSTGALPNGTTSIGDTKFVPNTVNHGANSLSFGIYGRSNDAAASTKCAMGVYNASSYTDYLLIRQTGNTFSAAVNKNVSVDVSNSTTQGFFAATRNSSTHIDVNINGTTTGGTASSPGQATASIYLSALNLTIWYDTNELAFAFIGQALTSTELNNLRTAVVTFETTLGRNV